jgi:hypothetical protein
LYEKYDARVLGQRGGGGEYEVQSGFGWTNGVVLALLQKYGDLVPPTASSSSSLTRVSDGSRDAASTNGVPNNGNSNDNGRIAHGHMVAADRIHRSPTPSSSSMTSSAEHRVRPSLIPL